MKPVSVNIINITININFDINIIIDRAQRLKDARQEALEEIEELKKRKNEELLEHERKVKRFIIY